MFLHYQLLIHCSLFSRNTTYTSCCYKYSLKQQMCISSLLKIVPNKFTISSCKTIFYFYLQNISSFSHSLCVECFVRVFFIWGLPNYLCMESCILFYSTLCWTVTVHNHHLCFSQQQVLIFFQFYFLFCHKFYI